MAGNVETQFTVETRLIAGSGTIVSEGDVYV